MMSMDRATLPHTQSIIALYTELDTECNQEATIVGRCLKPSLPGGISNRLTADECRLFIF